MTASVEVQELSSSLPTDQLWGAFRVKTTEGSRLKLVGWALGISAEVEAIQIVAQGAVVASTTARLPREDMAKRFPDRKAAADCGFELIIEARGKGESLLGLRAVLEGGTEVQMGEIRVLAPTRRWGSILRRH